LFLLENISLVQFKNYKQSAFDFRERIVCFSGDNGIGKTNLLDAIYYLCFTKSYFAKSDLQNVHHGSLGFRIEGNFNLDGASQKAVCILRETGKKEFFLNDEFYEKFSHHIGKFPCIIIAPDDVQIITGGSEERRRYLDALICQLDAKYLQNLIEYNRILQQRNSFLKSIAESRNYDAHLLQVYDEQLCEAGNYIFERRSSLLKSLLPLIKKLYDEIAESAEPIHISYYSQLTQSPLAELLRHFREKDLMVQRTNAGIHKDDIEVMFKNQSFKNIASQGQRKSLLFALKLAEFEILNEQKAFAPILLLDDVFEKLDEKRMYNLLNRVCIKNSGQVFITDTHGDRIHQHLTELNAKYQLISL
jgi:DNA replication and repair protein RecF